MELNLNGANAHLNRMVKQAKSSNGMLAVVSDHSQVSACCYLSHYLEDDTLHISFSEIASDSAQRLRASFDADDQVDQLLPGVACFYREGRLLALSMVDGPR